MLPSKRSHLSSQERTVWGDKSWRREGKVEDAFFFFLHGICFGKVVSSSSLAVICLVFMEPWITYHRSSEQPHFDINGQISLLEQSVQFSSVAQSCLTLRPHESQHARPLCPSPTPRVYSNSSSSSR